MMPSTLQNASQASNGFALSAASRAAKPQLIGHWIQALSHLSPKYGGLTAAVPQVSKNLAEHQNFGIALASFTSMDESDEIASSPALSVTHWPASRAAWWLNLKLRSRLRSFVSQADGLHLHGLWETHTWALGNMARSLGKPYIVSAHGMLDPWALANKGWKKQLYSMLVERPNLKGAACLHALTLAEAGDYRRYGCRKPIAIIPNGIDLPRSVDPSIFLDRYPALRGRRLVLFLGRLHFKKGLDILVSAWAKVHASFPDAVLVLAGPDSENSTEAVRQQVSSLGLNDSVVFTGMLQDAAKWSALANAHAFVLPSYSEGFSVAVLEAMGMGVPVIVSHECHVPEVESFGAGWQIVPKVEDLTDALQAMLSNSASVNAEIGNRGRHLVRERFSSHAVTQQMADLYKWVQGGPRPTSFELMEVIA